MKILINIEIENNKKDLNWHKEKGLSKELIEKLYANAFTEFLQQIVDKESTYTLNINAED